MKFGAVTPILRIFDEAKAREFYVDFLGFTVDFEHRFEPGASALHAGLARRLPAAPVGASRRCEPGAKVRIAIDDVERLHAELIAQALQV